MERTVSVASNPGTGAHTPVSNPLCGGDLSIQYISFETTKWVWNDSSSSGTTRLVLLCLAAYCNQDGWAFPSLDEIVDATKMSRGSILQAVESLEKLGEILVERHRGRGNTHRYYFQAFMEKVTKGIKSSEKVFSEEVSDSNQNENSLSLKRIREEEKKREELPSSSVRKFEEELERKRQHKEKKEARKRGERIFQKIPRTAAPSRQVVAKQPESWLWFSRVFKQRSDVNAVTMQELWPMVDEMLEEIGQEEAEERLSVYIDGAAKVSGYLAKDFLCGGWRTVERESEIATIENEE